MALNLVAITDGDTYFIDNPPFPGPTLNRGVHDPGYTGSVLTLTHFGGLFAQACISIDSEPPTKVTEGFALPSPNTKPMTFKIARFL
jgi:hypothetical protein